MSGTQQRPDDQQQKPGDDLPKNPGQRDNPSEERPPERREDEGQTREPGYDEA